MYVLLPLPPILEYCCSYEHRYYYTLLRYTFTASALLRLLLQYKH